jgi:hypothetical protein
MSKREYYQNIIERILIDSSDGIFVISPKRNDFFTVAYCVEEGNAADVVFVKSDVEEAYFLAELISTVRGADISIDLHVTSEEAEYEELCELVWPREKAEARA